MLYTSSLLSVAVLSTIGMEAFRGKYERISVENMDEFLKEMGVSFENIIKSYFEHIQTTKNYSI